MLNRARLLFSSSRCITASLYSKSPLTTSSAAAAAQISIYTVVVVDEAYIPERV